MMIKCYTQGCHLFFQKFFQASQISSRFLKVHIFGYIFSFNVSLRLKTILSGIKTLKRYCKATLNVFLRKKIFDDDKKIHLHDNFCVISKFYCLTCKKIPGCSRYFKDFCSKFQVFCYISQIPGFSRFFFA